MCATAKVIVGFSTHGNSAAPLGLNIKEDCLYRLTGFIMCQFQNFKRFIKTHSNCVNIIDNRHSMVNIIPNTVIMNICFHHLTLHQRICLTILNLVCQEEMLTKFE